jgi:hypothetical protein
MRHAALDKTWKAQNKRNYGQEQNNSPCGSFDYSGVCRALLRLKYWESNC